MYFLTNESQVHLLPTRELLQFRIFKFMFVDFVFDGGDVEGNGTDEVGLL